MAGERVFGFVFVVGVWVLVVRFIMFGFSFVFGMLFYRIIIFVFFYWKFLGF